MARELTLKELQDVRSFWWDEAQDSHRGIMPKLYEAVWLSNQEKPTSIMLSDGTQIFGTPTCDHQRRTTWGGPLFVVRLDGRYLVDAGKRLFIPGKWETEFLVKHSDLVSEMKRRKEEADNKKVAELSDEMLIDETREQIWNALNEMRGLAG